jgi:cytochrome c oxidase subunit 2
MAIQKAGSMEDKKMRRVIRNHLVAIVVASALIDAVVAAPDLDAGKQLFDSCATCHGSAGEGNPALNVPVSAGQSAWYVQRQLNNFRLGLRGAHPDDIHGSQMAAVAMTLQDPQAIEDVSAYIETLPLITPDPTFLSANIAAGKAAYVMCASCHGANGEGIRNLNAPRLSHQFDWYTAQQLENFREGLRGTHQKDFYGQQMRNMSMVLTDDAQIKDVSAYISTLN